MTTYVDAAVVLDAIARDQLAGNPTLLRAWHKARRTGRVTVWQADRLAIRGAGVHPDVLYGPGWDDAAHFPSREERREPLPDSDPIPDLPALSPSGWRRESALTADEIVAVIEEVTGRPVNEVCAPPTSVTLAFAAHVAVERGATIRAVARAVGRDHQAIRRAMARCRTRAPASQGEGGVGARPTV